MAETLCLALNSLCITSTTASQSLARTHDAVSQQISPYRGGCYFALNNPRWGINISHGLPDCGKHAAWGMQTASKRATKKNIWTVVFPCEWKWDMEQIFVYLNTARSQDCGSTAQAVFSCIVTHRTQRHAQPQSLGKRGSCRRSMGVSARFLAQGSDCSHFLCDPRGWALNPGPALSVKPHTASPVPKHLVGSQWEAESQCSASFPSFPLNTKLPQNQLKICLPTTVSSVGVTRMVQDGRTGGPKRFCVDYPRICPSCANAWGHQLQEHIQMPCTLLLSDHESLSWGNSHAVTGGDLCLGYCTWRVNCAEQSLGSI